MEDFLIIKKFYGFKAKKSQIATLFVVMLGVLLLFTTVVLDIAQVSFTKTNMDKAVDSGACMMGSILTSHAKQMSDQAVKGRARYSESGGFFSGWLMEFVLWNILAGLIIIGIILAPVGGWALVLWAVSIGAAIGAVSWGLSEVYRRQAVIEAYSDALKMFNSREAQYRETVLLGVVGAAVDDPIKVADTHDINRDGSTQDWVNRFDTHYEQRLRQLILEQEGISMGGGGGGGSGDYDNAMAAVDEIRDDLDDLRNGQPDNLLAFRDFLRIDLWDVFSQIEEPQYDSATLLSNYREAERRGYSAGVNILDLGRMPGYTM
ncbi:MAG: hypothetical protein JRI96_18150, partial [Deltaproteobacteria bacterium]|nr:hypothetical protein [Deltaproteobacteria bacterium]